MKTSRPFQINNSFIPFICFFPLEFAVDLSTKIFVFNIQVTPQCLSLLCSIYPVIYFSLCSFSPLSVVKFTLIVPNRIMESCNALDLSLTCKNSKCFTSKNPLLVTMRKGRHLHHLELVLTVFVFSSEPSWEISNFSCLSPPSFLSFFLCMCLHTYCRSWTKYYSKHGVCCNEQDRQSLCHLGYYFSVGKIRIEQLKSHTSW